MNQFLFHCKKISYRIFVWNVNVSRKLHLSNLISCKVVFKSSREGRNFNKPKDGDKNNLNPFNICLLIIPVTTFGLGVWQIRRKKWKEDLIAELNSRTKLEPVPLPENFNDLKNMEYYPVRVRGRYLHGKDIYIGPRSLIKDKGKGNVTQGLASHSKGGYLVVTPFELSDNGKTILVNRGWVPSIQISNNQYHQRSQNNEVEITGLVRLHEDRPLFGIKNNPNKNEWHYRDLYKMAEIANTEPVFIDADAQSSVPGGPIGGQTVISLRNEHLSYIITWFGLSVSTAAMWYMKFIRMKT